LPRISNEPNSHSEWQRKDFIFPREGFAQKICDHEGRQRRACSSAKTTIFGKIDYFIRPVSHSKSTAYKSSRTTIQRDEIKTQPVKVLDGPTYRGLVAPEQA
jgi:hypothetical protein